MIRVVKPARPAELTDGIASAAAHCAGYTANSPAYCSGEEKFEFSSAIYGHSAVRKALRDAQHAKCCFCEARFEANAAADVEHYRPKTYVQQGKGSPKLYPGYYWLAYDWGNLYYCCQVCNRSHKRTFFPLATPTARSRAHTDDVNDEQALLLDPGGPEDPRDHITFRDEIAVGQTLAGQTTIDVVGLNRPTLVEDRLGRLNELKLLSSVIQVFEGRADSEAVDLVEKARLQLAQAVLPISRFSAMAADLLGGAGAP